jgi:hypothetical protein
MTLVEPAAAADRMLFARARRLSPGSQLLVRFEEALDLNASRETLRQGIAMRHGVVDHDGISITWASDDPPHQPALDRALERLHALDQPIHVTSLEVGGSAPVSAAIGLETVLRMLFAEPSVTAIYLAGVTSRDADQPHAALLETDGGLTPAGLATLGLFGDVWWTDETAVTDDLGNASVRAFLGLHEVTAELADGTELRMDLTLRAGDEPELVVLQPLP